MRCLFCQNHQISQGGQGMALDSENLASSMIRLQAAGCHNINLVTPTHYLPQIVAALPLAIERGLNIPLVYNTNGYERVETLQLLEGIIDIYLPDIKYGRAEPAGQFSETPDYVEHNQAALLEMFGQVGYLELDDAGIAQRGLIIRHLVLPENLAASQACFEFIAHNLGREIPISLMGQYSPNPLVAGQNSPLNRKLTAREYQDTLDLFAGFHFLNGWQQDIDFLDDAYVPDFTTTAIFDQDKTEN
jgi:putative pyruvate formate lyase activating enzyme